MYIVTGSTPGGVKPRTAQWRPRGDKDVCAPVSAQLTAEGSARQSTSPSHSGSMQAAVLLCLLAACAVVAQDCTTPGLQCVDDTACCGGCCQGGMCTSTYQNCEYQEDLCLDHACPPGFQCRTYRAADCEGCALQATCSPFQDG
ncbi:uncharacterized protein LOC134542664 isoform X2 [Bacillus rossius redtenbacheri]|uniref:uncharacterized protein LOC134542664 isoform X2 n=1 Tax=Bacillus rossius redtenbacheri TaxID=93214 RepID=UPI002FDEBBCE